MKRRLQIFIATSAISAFACSALAQNATKTSPDGTEYSRQESTEKQRSDQLNGAAKASELIGMKVKNRQNEELGTVEDLWVDMESGRVVLVTLSSGGFIGIGSSLTAVPPGALKHDTAKQVLHLNVDKAKLESSPEFDADEWEKSSSSKDLAAIYRHYGEEPSSTFVGQGETRRDGQPTQAEQTDQAVDSRNVASRTNDRTWDQSGSASSRQATMTSEGSGNVQRTSKLIGMTVKNRQDETVGDVENIVVDLQSGRLVAVVISSGGFLGMGDELSAVSPNALRFSEDRDGLELDASKEMLSSAPHFRANQWPDFTQPDQVAGVYGAYQAEAYYTTKATTDVDNTRRNARDRNDETLTPMDQGNSTADIRITASIRREITAAENMSVNAQNVKIITKDGHVTLRGPINSPEEKQLIGEIAERIARPANVDNQLEVNLTVSSN